ncbi:hypothetical protein PV10_09142 [Exophiala mesophila]|uniref:Uncharacterized protein n=1 Tax=Exophiala mesophila TaxID=212818 RepID=A0A0D1WHD2_EXOME|nr:uncharacterized protein PV10_09142 [Exophiala mesophila]KIV88225.1 hypothetical protein PV10_09142 [Exophiala mesophila]
MAPRLHLHIAEGEGIDPDDAFNPFHRRLNDLTTDQRIHSATAKLRAIAAGFPSDSPRQDSGSIRGLRADSSSSQDSFSNPHDAAIPDQHLTSQQLYFRTYWQALPAESPRSLSPTPPPSQAPWRTLFHEDLHRSSPSPTHHRGRVSKGRVAKPLPRHSMVTRSKARAGQRFLALNFDGRPP